VACTASHLRIHEYGATSDSLTIIIECTSPLPLKTSWPILSIVVGVLRVHFKAYELGPFSDFTVCRSLLDDGLRLLTTLYTKNRRHVFMLRTNNENITQIPSYGDRMHTLFNTVLSMIDVARTVRS
jgi:hypothetical protein